MISLYQYCKIYILNMLSLLKLSYRYLRIKPQKLLQWRQKGGFIEFIVYNEKLSLSVIVMVNNTANFSDLSSSHDFQGLQFNLPKDIDPKRSIYNLLIQERRPLTIEVRNGSQIFTIKNQAKQIQSNIYIRNFQNPQGLYKHFKLNELDIGQTKRILTNYYLKLQTQAFCKLNNHTSKTQLTQGLKQQIFNYLNFSNQSNAQQIILMLQYQKQMVMRALVRVREEIGNILTRADRILQFYKVGVIGLTSIHLISFGYMIFWVQWLGWDIIQPLTYTVSMASVLLSLRFYRKFNKDKNDDNIRDRFRSFVLKRQYRLQWLRLKQKEKQDEKLLRQIEYKIKIQKNKLAQISTISTLL